MIYIEIEETKYPCQIETFHTQKGQQAIRVLGDAPLAHGFKLYADDVLLEDYSDFTYPYRVSETLKEYTQNEEEIIPASGYSSGIPENPIDKRFNAVNQRITDITPYEQTKKAYFGEIEKVFYGVPNGVMSVLMDGEFTTQKIEDRVYVRFERLTETKDITIMVQ